MNKSCSTVFTLFSLTQTFCVSEGVIGFLTCSSVGDATNTNYILSSLTVAWQYNFSCKKTLFFQQVECSVTKCFIALLNVTLYCTQLDSSTNWGNNQTRLHTPTSLPHNCQSKPPITGGLDWLLDCFWRGCRLSSVSGSRRVLSL